MTFDHFVLQQLQITDAEAFFAFVEQNRERIARYFPVTVKSTGDMDATRDFVNLRVKQAEKREFIVFVIRDRQKETIAGIIFFKDIETTIPKSEIGYFIDSSYEGQGIMSKVVAHITRYGFDKLQLNKVFMRIAENNAASIRVAEKNNFKPEGKLRNDFRTTSGELIDVLYYGLLKGE